MILSVAITTCGWLLVTFLTPPDDKETLREFVRRTRAGGPGWRKVYEEAEKEGVSLEGAHDKWPVPFGILCSVLGCAAIYAALFGVGAIIYGNVCSGSILLVCSLITGVLLFYAWRKLEAISKENEESASVTTKAVN